MQRPYTAQCAADATLSVRTSLPSFIERVCVSVCDCAVYSLLWSHPGWIFTCDEDCSCCLLHNGYRCLKTAKNKFSWCDLTNFSKNFLHYFRFRIILIFCQTVKGKCIYQSISRLFYLTYGGFLKFGPIVCCCLQHLGRSFQATHIDLSFFVENFWGHYL